jgi:hypothetical protein
MVAVIGGPADGRRFPLTPDVVGRAEITLAVHRPIRYLDTILGPTLDPFEPTFDQARYWIRYSDLTGWVAVPA